MISKSSYTIEEIRVMLEIVMKKFSRVTVWTAGSRNVSNPQEDSHYKDIEFYISKVAATINQNRGNKSITILQGIQYYDDNTTMKSEFRLAIESAEKANQLFSGTVEGFEFTNMLTKADFPKVNKTLKYLKELKQPSDAHLKVGTRMGYPLLRDFYRNHLFQNESQIVKGILQESDFVTCSIAAQDKYKSKGVQAAFEVVGKHLLEIRGLLRQNFTADELEVIGQLEWNSQGSNKWDNLKNMKIYWETADEWAMKNHFPIRFINAFDIPEEPIYAHKGWWRLTENSKSEQSDGYIEKVSNTAPGSIYSALTTISAAGIVGIVLGMTG